MLCQAESVPFADTTRGQGRILAMLKIQSEIAAKELAYILGFSKLVTQQTGEKRLCRTKTIRKMISVL